MEEPKQSKASDPNEFMGSVSDAKSSAKDKKDINDSVTDSKIGPKDNKDNAKESIGASKEYKDIAKEIEPAPIKEVVEPETQAVPEIPVFDREKWKPKTGLGKKIKAGEITSLSQILDQGHKILEAEIVDALLPDMTTELLFIGQSKGKFGGGQRRVFKQTQKKTAEGNKPHFAASCIVGNKDGFIGIGYGKSKETVPGREKAIRNAKLHIMKIRRGCGSWQCGCRQPHSIPFEVEGRCGSCRIKLMPAPRGTGLKIEKECGKVLSIAGIKDIWSITKGQTRTKTNLVMACIEALKRLISTRTPPEMEAELGIVEGRHTAEESHG